MVATKHSIALPNEASVRLHRNAGFAEVGAFAECAVKHRRYVNSVWMQRALSAKAQYCSVDVLCTFNHYLRPTLELITRRYQRRLRGAVTRRYAGSPAEGFGGRLRNLDELDGSIDHANA
ncbi:hypothetical protein PQQ96_40115 [Paraburkholderia sediminicola]|uniref:GNAT family N-acetyltransferase n=1 Tax=Paraburkholderia sediminicola TaxID=458836 RepID=UPI0038B6EFFE